MESAGAQIFKQVVDASKIKQVSTGNIVRIQIQKQRKLYSI